MNIVVTSILLGIILGAIGTAIGSAHWLITLALWGIAGLCVGLFSKNRKRAWKSGAVYGFVLSFSFLMFGYQGSHALMRMAQVLVFFVLLSVFGACCGALLGIVGNVFRKKR